MNISKDSAVTLRHSLTTRQIGTRRQRFLAGFGQSGGRGDKRIDRAAGPALDQRPLKTGVRFSMNALRPSL